MNKWQISAILVIPLILAIGIAPNMAFGFIPDSPYWQQKQGIAIDAINCREGMVLLISPVGKPNCAHDDEDIDRLIGFGWTKP